MTKRDLVVKIAAESSLTQQQVAMALQKILDGIVEALQQGKTIEFRNFGVFEIQQRKPRIGRNPNKPEQTVMIPLRKVVKFKPGRIMRKTITGR